MPRHIRSRHANVLHEILVKFTQIISKKQLKMIFKYKPKVLISQRVPRVCTAHRICIFGKYVNCMPMAEYVCVGMCTRRIYFIPNRWKLAKARHFIRHLTFKFIPMMDNHSMSRCVFFLLLLFDLVLVLHSSPFCTKHALFM